MIGNDIIDLNEAALKSNPLRPGFQKKIFTAEEQFIIKKSRDPVLQIWILWSMKESAYKAHQRRFNLKRKFNPYQLQCAIYFQDLKTVLGEVNLDSKNYYTHCDIRAIYLYCSATANKEQKIFNGIMPDSSDLKKNLLIKFSSLYNFPVSSLSVTKNENSVPFITNEKELLTNPFSLSHHGKFQAFSLPLMNY